MLTPPLCILHQLWCPLKAAYFRGNLDESQKVVQEMRKADHQFKTTEMDFLEAQIGLARKEREYLEHTKNEFKRGDERTDT
jgi:hypothetical protein